MKAERQEPYIEKADKEKEKAATDHSGCLWSRPPDVPAFPWTLCPGWLCGLVWFGLWPLRLDHLPRPPLPLHAGNPLDHPIPSHLPHISQTSIPRLQPVSSRPFRLSPTRHFALHRDPHRRSPYHDERERRRS
jgi:hypothetical protein